MGDAPKPTIDGNFDYAGWLAEPPSREEFYAFLLAFAKALDDNKVLSFSQLHESFTDSIAQRTVGGKQTETQTYSLRAWLTVLHRLANQSQGGKASPR